MDEMHVREDIVYDKYTGIYMCGVCYTSLIAQYL